MFANALADKRADFIGNPDLPTPTAMSRTSPPAWPRSGLTNARSVTSGTYRNRDGTTRQLLDLLAGDVGHPVGVRNLSKLAVQAFGVFNPLLRELIKMSYEFDASFVLDRTK